MRKRYLLQALSFLGLLVAIGAVIRGNQPQLPAPPAMAAQRIPYPAYIAGAGIVEPSTENIAIGTPVAGIVTHISVLRGAHVEAGDPLFEIDHRDLDARLLPAVADVEEKAAILNKAEDHRERAEALYQGNRSAISSEELHDRRFDLAIAQKALSLTQAQVEKLHVEIDRYDVTAPIAGRILQIKTHPGEFAPSGMADPPLMLLGGDRTLHLRIDIDEYDAWRFEPGAPATAFGRGNPSLQIPLTYVRTEPFVVPKTSLTGNGAEKTDTRVLQVIYSFDAANVPLYVGQQVDAYIKAEPAGAQ